MTGIGYQVDRGIAVITVNNPPVNALSAAIRIGLSESLATASSTAHVRAIVLTGDNASFIAGADVREMGTEQSKLAPKVRTLQHLLKACGKLTVAAIRGNALGAGLELALACDARVAAPDARFGFPEVNLGILPGAGGTQRLPHLTGAAVALNLLTSGRIFASDEALELGIIDAIVPDIPTGAVRFARQSIRSHRMFVPVLEQSDKLFEPDPTLFERARMRAKSENPELRAPFAIIDCVEAACTLAPELGLAFEEKKLEELRRSDQHPALRHMFIAERTSFRIPTDLKGLARNDLLNVAVVGMQPTLDNFVTSIITAGLSAFRIPDTLPADAGSVSGPFVPNILPWTRAAKIDLLFLPPSRNAAMLEALLIRLAQHIASDAIVAVDTSVGAASDRLRPMLPGRQFLDVNLIVTPKAKGLLHVTNGHAANPVALANLYAMAKKIKVPIVVSQRGDACARMWRRYSIQADFLLEEGVTPLAIDQAAEGLGMRIGPNRGRDILGLDIAAQMVEQCGHIERTSLILERLVAAGLIGERAKRGFYNYESERLTIDSTCANILLSAAPPIGREHHQTLTNDYVVRRLLLPVVTEATKCLEEGVILRMSDIDVMWVHGYGFPAYRGGPMYWARQLGFRAAVDLSISLASSFGASWGPSRLLTQLAQGDDQLPNPAQPMPKRMPTA